MLLRVALILVGLFAAAPMASATEILVHAAASLSNVLGEIAKTHEGATGVKVVLDLGASNALARQIIAGAPGDLFFSADEARMNDVERAGLLAPKTRVSLWSNTLVVVVPTDSGVTITSSKDLAEPRIKSVALADPGSVPAGIYAKAHLRGVGVWSRVLPKVVPCENVRAALAAVESGNVDAAIVYRTDARISTKVRVAYDVAVADAPDISYPVAILLGSTEPEAARAFLARVSSPESHAVFEKHGFIIRR